MRAGALGHNIVPALPELLRIESMMDSRRSLDGQRFEVVVIGGGINGVAIARECARRGKRTLLVEQNDFASGTTARSTRIIHGGLRYLEHGELGLVRESLRQREKMLRSYCHLVRPLKFLLAVPAGGRHSAMTIRAGLWLYSTMAGNKGPAPNGAREIERLLDSQQDWAIFDYHDAQCEFPERLVAEWLTEGLSAGLVARNHTPVLAVARRSGRACGIVARDGISGAEFEVEAEWIINATGPWADELCARSAISTENPLIGGVRGSHLILRRFPAAPASAVYTEAVDGRPFFVIPWNEQLLVGTTEVRDSGTPDSTVASADEIEYLFRSVVALFPAARIWWDDVRCAFAGVRPLPYAPQQSAAAVSRRHQLHDHADDGAAGMISVIGGKLTTAASLARECARHIGLGVEELTEECIARAPTCDGIDSALRQWAHQIAGMAGISAESARGLAEWYGRRALAIARITASDKRLGEALCPHSQHVVGEAVEAVSHECAVTLADILLRRVPVGLGACWSPECSRYAASKIGEALGWSPQRQGVELEAFEAERARFLTKVPGEVQLARQGAG